MVKVRKPHCCRDCGILTKLYVKTDYNGVIYLCGDCLDKIEKMGD